MYSGFLKRAIDFVAALLGFIVLFPIFIIVTLLLAVANEGKPFFLQPRPGRGERVFKVIKFRTMNDKLGEDGRLLPDEARLTRVGNIVRKTSLDEIPQLLNVLKGDMALVGPRPLLVPYLEYYSEEERKRHSVRPGITGWAQVNGRNAIGWDQKLALDIYYVKHLSFLLDMRILLLTVKKVVVSEGISAAGHATTTNFIDHVKATRS